MKRYLVIGLGKTGTTVISKTIQNSVGLDNYYLEPKSVAFFEHFANGEDEGVVKIIFDHWQARIRLLNGIVYNEAGTNFEANIFITRDPRAELISRLNYVAFPYFQASKRSDRDAEDWIDIFRRKESDPTFSLRELIASLADRFNVRVDKGAPQMTESYARYVGQLSQGFKTLVRYEDFISSNLSSHSLVHLFSGSRDVGRDLQRTRRSDGIDDWKSFVSVDDLAWLNDQLGYSIDALGYERDVEVGGEISPENCSLYVSRIIKEARELST